MKPKKIGYDILELKKVQKINYKPELDNFIVYLETVEKAKKGIIKCIKITPIFLNIYGKLFLEEDRIFLTDCK